MKGLAPVKDKRRFKNGISYLVNNVKNDFWINSAKETKPVLILFFNNIQYLIRENGLSQKKVSEGIKNEYGFSVSAEAITRFKRNDCFVSAHLSYLSALSMFFGEPLGKLLYVDYEQEAKNKAELTGT